MLNGAILALIWAHGGSREYQLVASPTAIEIARRRLHHEAVAIARVADTIDDDFVDVAKTLLTCNGKVFVSGSGTSGTIARRMAHLLSVCGTPAVFLAPMDALHGSSAAIRGEDVVLLISNGGSSSEVLELAHIARRLGAKIVVLTGQAKSPLAQEADHLALVNVTSEAEIGGVIATGVTLAQAAWGDALAEVLMRARGYTWAEFMKSHPAGAVGMRSDLPEDFPSLALTGSDS